MDLRFAYRLRHVRRHPGRERLPLRLGQILVEVVHGPDAQQGLVEQILLVGVGHLHVLDAGLDAAVDALPAPHRLAPFARHLGQDIETRAHVLPALGVVGGGGGQRVGPGGEAPAVPGVEVLDVHAAVGGMAANLIEGGEGEVPVEDRVLDPLGHHRARDLLQPQHELPSLGPVGVRQSVGIAQQQDVGDEVEDRLAGRPVPVLGVVDRAHHVLPIAGAHLDRVRLHVGAVDGEAGDRLGEREVEARLGEVAGPAMLLRDAVETARQHVELARHGAAQDQLLGAIDEVAEGGGSFPQAQVGAFDGPGAARIDEQPVEHVEELVAGRALDRPLARQGLVAGEDLLHDDVGRGLAGGALPRRRPPPGRAADSRDSGAGRAGRRRGRCEAR